MRAGIIHTVVSRCNAALLAGILVSAGLPAAAFAQDKPAAAKPDKKAQAAAKKAFTEAEKLYQAGDFAGAYESFRKANELAPSPEAQLWMGMSLANQEGKAAEAVAALEVFLNHPEASKVGDEKLSQAKSTLDQVRAKLVGELTLVTEPAGATVLVDGNPQTGETPMNLKLSPGAHTILITAPDYKTEQLELEIGAGETVERRIALTAEEPAPEPVVAPPPEPAAPPPPPPPEPEKRSKVAAYVTLGIAGAGAVVGTIFGAKALSAKSDYDANPTEDNADNVEQNALLADIAFGIVITVGLTGVVLLTSSDEPVEAAHRKLPAKARIDVAPYIGPKSGGAAARFSF